jgi:ATP-dependent DNA ligase
VSRENPPPKPTQEYSLERLWRRLQPLAIDKMPLEVPPLVLGRVHWVCPELVIEVKYLTWIGDNLLRQVVYEGLRDDKPAAEVRRPVPRHSRAFQPRLTEMI